MAVLLAACGAPAATPTQAPPPAEPTAEPPKPAEPTKALEPTTAPAEPTAAAAPADAACTGKVKVPIFVGMGTGTDPDQIRAQEELAAKFNSTHDDIEIEFMIVPHDDVAERFLAMVSGGNAPGLVGPNGVSTIAQFLDLWEDITPYIEKDNYDLSDFYEPSIKLNEYPGLNTGLPFGLYPSFLFYNKDLFDAAGLDYPPSDFDDKAWDIDKLHEVALKLTKDKDGNDATSPDFDPKNITQWGYDDSWITLRGQLAEWGAEGVGRPTSADYKTAMVNTPEWVKGAQWHIDGVQKEHFLPDSVAQEARDSAGLDPFGAGTLGMFHSHTWFLSEGIVDLPFAFDIAPTAFNEKGQRIARIHADNFTMPKDFKCKEAAWEVMKWIVEPENNVEACKIYGCLPARISAVPAFTEYLKEQYPGINYDVIFKSIDYLDAPNHESWVPEWGRVEDVLANTQTLIYTGQADDAQKLMDETNAEIQKILDEYWAKQK
jgi:multiple sugar transport system substrate-binding protein